MMGGPSRQGPIPGIKADGVTERLQLYTFDKEQVHYTYVLFYYNHR
jgi:hypothetical protein